jgi:hypothetical protein
VEDVTVPSAPAKADNRIAYQTWQQMLLVLIAVSVCGETRDNRRGTSWKTHKLVINAAQKGLADDLFRWKKAVGKHLQQKDYIALPYSKAEAWREWVAKLQEEVYKTSRLWRLRVDLQEGIREAAKVIVSLFLLRGSKLFHWMAKIRTNSFQLAKDTRTIDQEVVSMTDCRFCALAEADEED